MIVTHRYTHLQKWAIAIMLSYSISPASMLHPQVIYALAFSAGLNGPPWMAIDKGVFGGNGWSTPKCFSITYPKRLISSWAFVNWCNHQWQPFRLVLDNDETNALYLKQIANEFIACEYCLQNILKILCKYTTSKYFSSIVCGILILCSKLNVINLSTPKPKKLPTAMPSSRLSW